jgi:hypothetical protein
MVSSLAYSDAIKEILEDKTFVDKYKEFTDDQIGVIFRNVWGGDI